MGNSHLRLVTPATVNRTVTPRRVKNSELRSREYLTAHEVDALMAAARQNRQGHRDATMILLAFRHGLRTSEVVDLRWDQVDFNCAVLHVRRTKQGTPSVHPLSGPELRALRRLQRASEGSGPFVFVSERDAPFTTAGFARMVERAGPRLALGSGSIPTCFVMPVGMRWRTQGTIHALCKPISGTGTSSTPSGTPS
jgi:type 1 fimbriae regulatory protein FimB/type 1 fimbriae regulatory protein FimE